MILMVVRPPEKGRDKFRELRTDDRDGKGDCSNFDEANRGFYDLAVCGVDEDDESGEKFRL